MFYEWNRDPAAGHASPAGVVAMSMLLMTGMLFPTVAWASSAPKIGEVTVEGSNLTVDIEMPEASELAMPLKLTLFDESGALVETSTLAAEGAQHIQQVSLDGEFEGLPTRGWQHRLELADATGAVLEKMDLRFDLDCTDAPCDLRVSRGLLIAGAVSVDKNLRSWLSSGMPVDFDQLRELKPSLAGSLYETSVDLGQRVLGTRCTCFFTASVAGGGLPRSVISGRFENGVNQLVLYSRWREVSQGPGSLSVDHTSEKEISMDFGCFYVTYSSIWQVVTSSGLLSIPTPELTPCARSCAPQVSWQIRDPFYNAYLDTSLDISSSATYDFTWMIDGAERYQHDRTWFQGGAQWMPYSASGPLPQPSASFVTAQMPTTSRVGGWAMASIWNVSQYDRPQVEVAAGATLEASGQASCAANASVVAMPSEWGSDMAPATLAVVLGPDEDP